MNIRSAALACLAATLLCPWRPAWTSGPGAASPALMEPGAKGNSDAPRSRFAGPVSFHSSGRISYAAGSKDRDRTITLTPITQNGVVSALDTTIVDHVEDDFAYQGQLFVDEHGAVWARQKEMINAANILSVSPKVIERLRAGEPQVVTRSNAEISGDIYDVNCTHVLIGDAKATPVRVKTTTETPDGKIRLETTAAFASDGLPLSAQTSGTIKVVMNLNLTVDLRLTRLASAK